MEQLIMNYQKNCLLLQNFIFKATLNFSLYNWTFVIKIEIKDIDLN